MKKDFNEDRSPADLLDYPRFDEREVIFRWRKEWYDGPINGAIFYQGARYWFDFYCDTDEPGNPYFYLVYPLTSEEADFADRWSTDNEGFRQAWGPLANDPTTKDLPQTKEITAKWKEHEKLLPNYSDRIPVAWFVSGANQDFYGVKVYKKID